MSKTQGKEMAHTLIQTQHDVNKNGLDAALQRVIQPLIQKIDSLHAKVDTLSNKLDSTFKEQIQTQDGRCVDQLKVQDRHDSDLESECSRHSLESDDSGHVVVTNPDGYVEPRSKENRTRLLTTTDLDLSSYGITSNLSEPCQRFRSEQKKERITYVREIDSLHANVDTLSKGLYNTLDNPFKEPGRWQAGRGLGVVRKTEGDTLDDFAPGGFVGPLRKRRGTRHLTTTDLDLSSYGITSNLSEPCQRFRSEQKKERITYVREIDSLHANVDTLSKGLYNTLDNPFKEPGRWQAGRGVGVVRKTEGDTLDDFASGGFVGPLRKRRRTMADCLRRRLARNHAGGDLSKV